ncbi:Uncharacterised protein [Yersinia enterocolitica]|nr:Uncharacterised protein [Yersinia enterocolitica]CQI04266.1 Uncharacterised protein [Yersinia enterocolitica]CQI08887.1 Uncharacterised protein [Yersinia enterocolitica]CQR11885.1 Uncharacterised protein [Yersinia enterocolitica]
MSGAVIGHALGMAFGISLSDELAENIRGAVGDKRLRAEAGSPTLLFTKPVHRPEGISEQLTLLLQGDPADGQAADLLQTGGIIMANTLAVEVGGFMFRTVFAIKEAVSDSFLAAFGLLLMLLRAAQYWLISHPTAGAFGIQTYHRPAFNISELH